MDRRAPAVLVIILLSGCPGRSAPTPSVVARADAADTAPVATGTPLAGFDDVKVGQVYRYELLMGGEREDTITARDADAITLTRKSKFGSQEGQPTTVTVPLRAPGSPPDFEVPKDAKVVTLGKESVAISGHTFACEIRETTFSGATRREWLTASYPFVVKTVANGFMTIRLQEILDHPAPEAK